MCVRILASQEVHAHHAEVLETVELGGFLREACGDFALALGQQGGELVLEAGKGLRVQAVPLRLRQLVINLLTNAAQAVEAARAADPAAAPARVLLSAAPGPETGTVLVRVQDNGVGIAAEHLEAIFSRGVSQRPGGRGIGLHYCALAAQQMGGRLWAESAGPGRGASFQLLLQAA